MDLKVDGLSYEVLSEALEQAKRGRLHILDAMEQCMPSPRADLKPQTPSLVPVTLKSISPK